MSGVTSPRSNLPRLTPAFFGGKEELARLDALFRDGACLVTLMGPPGIGKSRLAIRHAERWHEARSEGAAWLCDLADAASTDEAVDQLARTLGVDMPPGVSGAAA